MLGRNATPLGARIRLKQALAHVAGVTFGAATLLRAAALSIVTGCTGTTLRCARATLVSATTGGTTASLISAGITAVLLNLALLAKFRVAPAFRVTYNQMYALHAGSSYLLLGILRLRSHTDREQTEIRETHALAVENQLLQMVESIHQHTVNSTTRVRRTVVRDVRYESLEIHLAVGYSSGIPLFLTSVLAALWCTLQFTILQCSFESRCKGTAIF